MPPGPRCPALCVALGRPFRPTSLVQTDPRSSGRIKQQGAAGMGHQSPSHQWHPCRCQRHTCMPAIFAHLHHYRLPLFGPKRKGSVMNLTIIFIALHWPFFSVVLHTPTPGGYRARTASTCTWSDGRGVEGLGRTLENIEGEARKNEEILPNLLHKTRFPHLPESSVCSIGRW